MWMQQLASQAKASRSPTQLKLAIEVRKLWMAYEAANKSQQRELLGGVVDALARDGALLRMEGMVENLLDAPKLCAGLVGLLEVELSPPDDGCSLAERLADSRAATALELVSLLARNAAYVGMISSGGVLPLLARALHVLGSELPAPPSPGERLSCAESSLSALAATLTVMAEHRFAVAVMTSRATGIMGGAGGGVALAQLFALVSPPAVAKGEAAEDTAVWPPPGELQRIARGVALRAVTGMDASTAKYLHAQACVKDVVTAVEAAAEADNLASPEAREAAVELAKLVTAMLATQSTAERVWPQLQLDFGQCGGYVALAKLACAGAAAGRSAPSRDVAAAAVGVGSGLVSAAARFRDVDALRCLLQIFRECMAAIVREGILKELHHCLETSPGNYSAMCSGLAACPLVQLLEVPQLQPVVHHGVMELLGYVAIVLEEVPAQALSTCTAMIGHVSLFGGPGWLSEPADFAAFLKSDEFKNVSGVISTLYRLLKVKSSYADLLRNGGLVDAVLSLLGAFVDGVDDPGHVFAETIGVLLVLLEGEGRSAQGNEGECGQVLVLCMKLLSDQLVAADWARSAALRCLRQLIRMDTTHAVTYVNVLVSALPGGQGDAPCSRSQLNAASEILQTVSVHCSSSSGRAVDSQLAGEFRQAFIECGGFEKLVAVAAMRSGGTDGDFGSADLLREVLSTLVALTQLEQQIRATLLAHGYYARMGAAVGPLQGPPLAEVLNGLIRSAIGGAPLDQPARIIHPELLLVAVEALQSAPSEVAVRQLRQMMHLLETRRSDEDAGLGEGGPSLSFLSCVDFDGDQEATRVFSEHLEKHGREDSLQFLLLTHEFRERFGGSVPPREDTRALFENLEVILARAGSSKLHLSAELVRQVQRYATTDEETPGDPAELLQQAAREVSQGLQEESFATFRSSPEFRNLLHQRVCATSGQYCTVNKEALCTAGVAASLIRVFGTRLFTFGNASPVISCAQRLIQLLCAHRMSADALRLVCCARQTEKFDVGRFLTSVTQLQREAATWPSIELCHATTGCPHIRCDMPVAWPPSGGYSFSCWVCINQTDRNTTIHLCSVGTEDAPTLYNSFRIAVQKGEVTQLIIGTNSDRNAEVFEAFDFAVAPGWHHLVVSHSWKRIGSSMAQLYVDGLPAGDAVRIPFPAAPGLWGSAVAPVVHLGTPRSLAEPRRTCWVSIGATLLFMEALLPEMVSYVYLAGPEYCGRFHRDPENKFLSHVAFMQPAVLATVAASVPSAQSPPSDVMSTLRQYGVIGGSDLVDLPVVTIPRPALVLKPSLALDGTGPAVCDNDGQPVFCSEEALAVCPQALSVPLSELGGIHLVLTLMDRAKTEAGLFHGVQLLAAAVHGGGVQVEADLQRESLFMAMLVVVKPKASLVSERVVRTIGQISGVEGWQVWSPSPLQSVSVGAGAASETLFTASTLANHEILFPLLAFIWMPFPEAVQRRVLQFFIGCIRHARTTPIREFNVQRLCKVELLAALLMLLDNKDSDGAVEDAIDLMELMLTTPHTAAVDPKSSREAMLQQVGDFLVSILPADADGGSSEETGGRSQRIRDLILNTISDAIGSQLRLQRAATTNPFVDATRRVFSTKWLLVFIDPQVEPATVVLALDLLRQLHLGPAAQLKSRRNLSGVYERLSVVLPSFGRCEEVYGALLALLFGEEKARPYALQPATWMYDWASMQVACPDILPIMLCMVRGILGGEAAAQPAEGEDSDAADDASLEGSQILADVGLWMHTQLGACDGCVYEPPTERAAAEPLSPSADTDILPVEHGTRNPFCFEPGLIGPAVLMEGPLRISGTGTALLNCAIVAKKAYFEMTVVTTPCRFRVGVAQDQAIDLDGLLTSEYVFTDAEQPDGFAAGDTVGVQFDQSLSPATLQFFIGSGDAVKVISVQDGAGPWPAVSVSAGSVELKFDKDSLVREAPVGFECLVQEGEAAAEVFLSEVVQLARGRVEVIYSYENQRKLRGEWNSSYLYATDRAQWSTGDGFEVAAGEKDFFRTLLTDDEHWISLTGWSPAPLGLHCDCSGWEYADQFLTGAGSRSQCFRGSPAGFPLVRRRRWQRLRCFCRGNPKVIVSEDDLWWAWNNRLSSSPPAGSAPATEVFGSEITVPASDFPLLAKWYSQGCSTAECVSDELRSCQVWNSIVSPQPQTLDQVLVVQTSPIVFDTWHGGGAPVDFLRLIRTMLQEVSGIKTAVLNPEVSELLVDILFTATRSVAAPTQTIKLMQTPLQLLTIECLCLIVAHGAPYNESHEVLRTALAVSSVHTQDERLQSVYYTRVLSYLMNFFSQALCTERISMPQIATAAQQFAVLLVHRLTAYQLVVQDHADGIMTFLVQMLQAASTQQAASALGRNQVCFTESLQQCVRDVIVFQLCHCSADSVAVATLIDQMLLNRAVVLPAIVTDNALTTALCFHAEPLLHVEDMSIVAVQFFKQLMVHKSSALAELLVHRSSPPEEDEIGNVDLLHGGFDKLLQGTAAFQEWLNANRSTVRAVLKIKTDDVWRQVSAVHLELVAETAHSWSSFCISTQARTQKHQDAVAVQQRSEAADRMAFVQKKSQHERVLLQQYKMREIQQQARVAHEWERATEEVSLASGLVVDTAPVWRLDFTIGPSRMRKKLRLCDAAPSYESRAPKTPSTAVAAARVDEDLSPGVTDRADQGARGRLQGALARASHSLDTDDDVQEADERADEDKEADPEDDVDVDAQHEEKEEHTEDDPLTSQLDRDERILDRWNCARVHGMDHVDGVFLVCAANFYCCDGYHIQPDGSTVEIAQPPAQDTKGGWSFQQDSSVSGEVNDDELPNDRCHVPGDGAASVAIPHKLRKWSYQSVREVHKRRYQLRLTGLEFFSIDGDKGDLIIFPSERSVVSQVYKAVMKRTGMPHNDQFGILDDELKESGATEITRSGRLSRLLRTFTTRWQEGSMSNFEYLMRLNTMAHRSYNDLTQYPVFPWVLSDYTSDEIDLDDPTVYRDLSKPMGAMTEPRRSKIKERYETWDPDDPVPAFHYGSHYSSSATVLHYLIRLEPFTQHSYELQSGRFDHPDRLFFSVREAWESASQKNMSDVKELIPELYYMPEVLENVNDVEFGQRMNGSKEKVGAVELPPWAHGDSRLFVRKMRQALESEHVSSHLHEWIDLIFGYKQLGAAAEEALNVFYYLTYEGMVDMDSISDPMERRVKLLQINSFGQTPGMLFHAPHPPRAMHNPRIEHALYTAAQQLEIVPRLRGVVGHDFMAPGDGIGDLCSLGQADTAGHRIAMAGLNRVLIPRVTGSIANSSVGAVVGGTAVRVMAWGFPDRTLRVYPLSDANNPDASPLRVYQGGFAPGDAVTTSLAISRDGRLMVTGGTDRVLYLWEERQAATTAAAKVTDAGTGSGGSGSGGGGGGGTGFELKKRLFGHTAALTALAVCDHYALIVSGDSSGCICLWDSNRRQLVSTLQAGGGCTGVVRAVGINHSSGDIVTSVATEPISPAATIGADGATPRNVLSVWSVNGGLVAQRANIFDARGGGGGDAAVCCLGLTEGPEWLDTNLVVTGHTDGSVRMWSVVPCSSRVPAGGPAFELMLRRRVRGSGGDGGAPGHGSCVTKIFIGNDPFARTMYTADKEGTLLQWEVPGAA